MKKNWLKIVMSSKDLSEIIDMITFYEEELDEASKEIKIVPNKSIEAQCASLPGLVQYRFNQWREVNAVLEHLDTRLRNIEIKNYKDLQATSKRSLAQGELKMFARHDTDYVAMAEVVNQVRLLCEKFEGISKALESKSFQLNNITKLKTAGLENSEIGI